MGARLTTKEFITVCKKVHKGLYRYNKTFYTLAHNYVTINCPIHGEFEQKASVHKNGHGCKVCKNIENGKNRRFDIGLIQNKIDNINGVGKYKILKHSEYINRDSDISVGCLQCGKVIRKSARLWWECNYSCPKCYPRRLEYVSDLEKSILRYIKLIYKEDIIQSDREIISPYELDIVLPDIKLAIEVNGTYWHSDKIKGVDYHYNKTATVQGQGYSLFYIWEDQWINKTKRMIIKSMLKSKLGKIKNKIYARKTTVKKLDKTPMQFYNNNHLQGAVGATYNYGLFLEDELVSAMSFKKDGELIRFTTKINTQVIGGFSKLLKAFERDNPQIKEIVSFSDNDYSDGKVYKENGFKIIKELKQDYFYIKPLANYLLIRKHKSSMRKEKLGIRNSVTTEKEYVESLGLLRCYNSGKIKWRYFTNV